MKREDHSFKNKLKVHQEVFGSVVAKWQIGLSMTIATSSHEMIRHNVNTSCFYKYSLIPLKRDWFFQDEHTF